MAQITPPGNLYKQIGLHWLKTRTDLGIPLEWVALQWNPGSKTWTHANCHDTFGVKPMSVETDTLEYHSHIPYPE